MFRVSYIDGNGKISHKGGFKSNPTTENIYNIAKDICAHSVGQNVENVMFCLAADAIHTFYDVEKIEQ